MEVTSITLPENLAQALASYIRDRQASPSPTAVIQIALEDFLKQRGYLPTYNKRLRITSASVGSGYTDTSVNHDEVLANQ